jgi:hypothetical protein
MIRCKKFVTTKKLIKKKHSQAKPVHRNWLEPCKTVHPSKLKPAPMSNKVREIIEQRILTNLAISGARASIRAAKREKARVEAEQETAELEQKTTLSEPVNARTSKGSRRPPNPLVVYKKYLERCKAASEARVRRFGQESASQNLTSVQNSLAAKPGPSWISREYQPSTTSAVCGHNLNCDQDMATRKVSTRKATFNEPFPDPSNELDSIGQSKNTLRTKVQLKKVQKSSNKEQESDESEGLNLIDQPGTSKDDDNMFKKPFPVKLKAPKHEIVTKEAGKKKDKTRNRRYWVADKMNAMKNKFPALKDLLVNQNKKVARITKLHSEKACSQKIKQNVRKSQTAKAVDLFEMLHDLVLLICDQVSYTLHL